jgi:phenylalanyl-tRNA synthetase alpha chain
MQDKLSALLNKARGEFAVLRARPEFEAAKARFVGPNGELTALMKLMGTVPKDQRPALGRAINESKAQLQALLDLTLRAIEDAEIAAQLGPAVDPSLPAPDGGPGTCHPLTLVREEMCRILRKVGFTVADGPEVETEFYCFDALNTPPDHPSRDITDTFYFPDTARFGNISRRVEGEKYLLRTHTSSVQIRTMLKRRPSGSSRPAAPSGATPPTPRTAPTSTNSNAWPSTGTSPCGISRRCSISSSPRSSDRKRRPASARTISATPSRASRSTCPRNTCPR